MERLPSAKATSSLYLGLEPNHREPVEDRILTDCEASGEDGGSREVVEV